MYFLKATAKGRAQLEVYCEMCRIPQWPGDEDWQLHLDEVEEVEISWAHGDQGMVRRFATKYSFDLCPTCEVQFENSKHSAFS